MRFRRREERNIAGDVAYWLRLAKGDCFNHSESGAWGTRHYCCIEPKATQTTCLLTEGTLCGWFGNRVVRQERFKGSGIQTLWDRFVEQWKLQRGQSVQGPESNNRPSDAPIQVRLCEKCRSRFRVRSNRQRLCPPCSDKNRKLLNSQTSRRHRAKAQRDTLGSHDPATGAV